MSDIVKRLRTWTHSVDAAPVSDVLDQAADEIERLRMTAEEVRAVKALLHQVEVYNPQWAATLRGLLERTK